jgi:hypothetical protein
LSYNTNRRTAASWTFPLWPYFWLRRGSVLAQDAKRPKETLRCERGNDQLIAKLSAAHARAYRAGRHVEAIRLTKKLNAARGLVPKRSVDRRDDVQRDHDEERADGWSVRAK